MAKFHKMAKCVFSWPAELKNSQSGNPVLAHQGEVSRTFREMRGSEENFVLRKTAKTK